MTERNESIIPLIKQGKFVIVDTTLKMQDVMHFAELSGDYGDAGRVIYLAIKGPAASNDPKKPSIPFDLTDKDI
ncbi:hypothetical protein [Weissella minor]|uniref:hypothetical protein n=1 Tax=Weissella minor TaxID=1620 RepID=UPI000709C998|nr:hypothetical protein [Weissella minor]